MITREDTAEIVKEFGAHEKDAGATAVQIAIITKRINNLKGHFQHHIHDFHSNRGLLKMIGKRRSLLRYLARKRPEEYKTVIKKLGLRK